MSSSSRASRSPRQSIAVLGVGLLAVAGLAGAASSGAQAAPAPFSNTIIQIKNPTNGSTLQTAWQSEVTSAQQWGYTQTDELFVASRTAQPGLVAVYRLYKASSKDFFDTTLVTERDSAVANYGYVDQGIKYFVAAADTTATEPVIRYQKQGLHRFALSPSDQAALDAAGWNREGVKFYAAPTDADASQFGGTTTTVPTTSTTTTTTSTTVPTTSTTTSTTVPTTSTTTTTTVPPSTGHVYPLDGDGIFSIAVAPDTQRELYSDATQLFDQRVDMLVAERDARDIRWTTQTGDLVDWSGSQTDPTDHHMYEHVSDALEAFDDDDMPYLLTIGNHDTGAVCYGGSACPGLDISKAIRDTTIFNSFFGYQRHHIPLPQQFEAGKVDNAFKTFEAEGTQWLALTLEMNPRVAVVDWAKQVVASHPDHNVLVTSHYLLDGNGTISNSNSGYGATSGRYVFDNLLLAYPNVKLVFSGHVGSAAHRTDVGVNGNKVVSMVGTLHESNFNPTRMVTIDVAAGTVEARITANNSKSGQALPNYSQFDVSVSGMTFID